MTNGSIRIRVKWLGCARIIHPNLFKEMVVIRTKITEDMKQRSDTTMTSHSLAGQGTWFKSKYHKQTHVGSVWNNKQFVKFNWVASMNGCFVTLEQKSLAETPLTLTIVSIYIFCSFWMRRLFFFLRLPSRSNIDTKDGSQHSITKR